MFPPTPPNFILFQLDFDVKFPLLRLLLFLIDLKSTILLYQIVDCESKTDFFLQLCDSKSFLNLFASFYSIVI